MVVNKIPKRQEAFIEGNQEVKKEKPRQKFTHLHNVLVRIPQEMHEKIDIAIKERPIKISRNMWILEAINANLE